MVASSACEVTEIFTQRIIKTTRWCEDYSDLTNPTSNKIPDKLMAVSVVYDTLKIFYSALFIHVFNCEMKMSEGPYRRYFTGQEIII